MMVIITAYSYGGHGCFCRRYYERRKAYIYATIPAEEKAHSGVGYSAIKQELEERNKQRDELLVMIKTLTDKNKTYKCNLEKEEQTKKQQLTILRKTHITQLEEKDGLITTLREIIEELETKIKNSEKRINGNVERQESLHSGTTKLIDHIQHLQQEHVTLTQQLTTAQCKLESCQQDHLTITSSLEQTIAKQEKENAGLRDELHRLQQLHLLSSEEASPTGPCTTDTEKQLEKAQAENDKLQREIHGLRSFTLRSSSIGFNPENERMKILEDDNHYMKLTIDSLEKSSSNKDHELHQLETKYREEVSNLLAENQKVSRQMRELQTELTSLQAKEPDVVTKFQKVQVKVDSEELKDSLRTTQEENSKLQAEVQTWKDEYDDVNSKCDQLQHQLDQLHHKICMYQEEKKELEQVLMEEVEEKEKMQTSLQEELEEMRQSKEIAVEETRKLMEDEMNGLISRHHQICQALSWIGPQCCALLREHQLLKKQAQKFPELIATTVASVKKQLQKSLQDVTDHNKELIKKYHREMHLRKKYHNELVELKGNIRVFCRVRPCIKEDMASGGPVQEVVSLDKDDDGLICINNKGRNQTFEVDRVFSQSSTQIEVFDEVRALVTSCIDGYNVCIFAYGQTGSGKTHTMEGPTDDPGINQRALQELFKETTEKGIDWQFTISVSMLEIYNETIRDLLNSDTPGEKLDVKMNPEGGLHVPGLVTREVHTVADVNKVFKLGHKNRATASTNVNEHSSRSHALLCVTVTGVNKTTHSKTFGKLNLVDLAGSERVSKSGADGTRLREAQNINKSLSCLGDVIHALRSKQNFIPYRNSKLTYMLQDSLGGDSKTLMIVQVAPVENHISETACSLAFAQRVRTVELGTATKRTENGDTEVKRRDFIS